MSILFIILIVCAFAAGVACGCVVGALETIKNSDRVKSAMAKPREYKIKIESGTQPAFVPSGYLERKVSEYINERIQLDKESVTIVQIVKARTSTYDYDPFSLVVAKIPVGDPEYDQKLMRAMAQAEERMQTLEVVNDSEPMKMFLNS